MLSPLPTLAHGLSLTVRLCAAPLTRPSTGPNNMVTSLTGTNATYSNSARYFTSLGDTMGFTDEAACVTQPGYGMSGRNAQPCDKGFWNGPNNYETCKACAYGLTTEGIAKGVAEASCGIAQGFGNVSGLFMPCPIGELRFYLCLESFLQHFSINPAPSLCASPGPLM